MTGKGMGRTKENVANPFKTDLGVWITQGLFLEIAYNTNMAIFTLQDDDRTYKGKEFVSLKKRYLELEDPTEYDFATEYTGGWGHWKRMCSNTVLIRHITEWREELALKLRARGVRGMINEAVLGGRSQAAAARWLAEKGFIEKPLFTTKRVGRPTEKLIKQEAKEDAKLRREVAEDLKRIALN